jgi:hypothetical protein
MSKTVGEVSALISGSEVCSGSPSSGSSHVIRAVRRRLFFLLAPKDFSFFSMQDLIRFLSFDVVALPKTSAFLTNAINMRFVFNAICPLSGARDKRDCVARNTGGDTRPMEQDCAHSLIQMTFRPIAIVLDGLA